MQHQNPRPAKLDDWDDDDWPAWDHEWFWGHSQQETIEVHEEDDEEERVFTGILGPDGSPIYLIYPSEKQGFIGFLGPDNYEDIRTQQMKRKKWRNRRARKSEA